MLLPAQLCWGSPENPWVLINTLTEEHKVQSNIQNKQLFPLLSSLQFQVLWRFFFFWVSHLICTLIFPHHLNYKLFTKFFRVTGEFWNLYTVFVSGSPSELYFLFLSASVDATVLLEGGCWENSFHIKALSDSESSHYQRDSFGHFTIPWASIKILGLG